MVLVLHDSRMDPDNSFLMDYSKFIIADYRFETKPVFILYFSFPSTAMDTRAPDEDLPEAKRAKIEPNSGKLLARYTRVLFSIATEVKQKENKDRKERSRTNQLESIERLLANQGVDAQSSLLKAPIVKGFQNVEEHLHFLLKKHYGFASFRGPQLSIMKALSEGKDIFAKLPTGAGKTLLFTLPALLKDGCAIVISPLLALIQDQLDKFDAANIPAVSIEGSTSEAKRLKTYKLLKDPENPYKLTLLTPEQYIRPAFQEALVKMHELGMLLFIAIDEAHQVDQSSFLRPSFTQIGELRKKFPGVPQIAVTATASSSTQKNCLVSLEMKNASIFNESIDRENIRITIMKKDPKRTGEKIISLLRKHFQSKTGIIYVHSRNDSEQLNTELLEAGIKSVYFHGALSPKEKKETLQLWMQEKAQVVVSTTALGAGIDKSNVAYVIHSSVPKCFEDYVQHIGRAGRDGKPSEAICLYSPVDVKRSLQLVSMGKSENQRQTEFLRVLDMQEYFESRGECRRSIILQNFDEAPITCNEKHAEKCDVCNQPLNNWTLDVTNEVFAILEGCRLNGEFDIKVFLETLKGNIKPKANCAIVGLLRKWPGEEVDRLIGFLCRKKILSRKIRFQGNARKASMSVSEGPNSDVGFEDKILFPITRAHLNEIEAQKYNANPNPVLDSLQIAATKFVTPDVEEIAMDSTASQPDDDYRGCF